MPLMPFDEALVASERVISLSADLVNDISFGPNAYDRYSGVLISLAISHMGAITSLLDPGRPTWPSAFALSRVAAEAALRAVFLGLGETIPDFSLAFTKWHNEGINPFGSLPKMLNCIRVGFGKHPAFEGWRAMGGEQDQSAFLQHVQQDWSTLCSFTHGGEILSRLVLQALQTGQPPHENIRTTILFSCSRVVVECSCLIFTQRGGPELGGSLALQFLRSFPPERMVDDTI